MNRLEKQNKQHENENEPTSNINKIKPYELIRKCEKSSKVLKKALKNNFFKLSKTNDKLKNTYTSCFNKWNDEIIELDIAKDIVKNFDEKGYILYQKGYYDTLKTVEKKRSKTGFNKMFKKQI